MESLLNKTDPSWQHFVDILHEELEHTRNMPTWAVAVIISSCISTFLVLIGCGVGFVMIMKESKYRFDQNSESISNLVHSYSATSESGNSSTRVYDSDSIMVSENTNRKQKSNKGKRIKFDKSVEDIDL